MKSSGLLRAILLGMVVTFVTTSCGFFQIQNEVGIKEVGVDLVFGGAAVEEPVQPPDIELPEVPPIELPEPPPPEPPPPPPPPLCPPTTAIAARDPAVAAITNDHRPEEGNYLHRFDGNFEDQRFIFTFGNKVISNVADSGEGFEYSIQDRFNLTRLTFRAQPISETNPLNGLFLVRVEIPEEPPTPLAPSPRLLTFEPAAPLRLLAFPIQAGAEEEAQAIDVAPKSTTPISDPLTGSPILSPSGNAISSFLRVDSPERIQVCEDLAQGYKAAWDIEITGEFNLRILGSFWLGTQYGGWPIKDEYVVIGDLIPGNFASNLARLDPGDFI